MIIKVLEPIGTTKTPTASRVRGRIECVLDWTATRGYRKGENPARWRGHLENLLPRKTKVRKVKHRPALPYDDIGDFMPALKLQEAIPARALEFLILTAGRTNEVLGARRGEIDFQKALSTVPPDRMRG